MAALSLYFFRFVHNLGFNADDNAGNAQNILVYFVQFFVRAVISVYRCGQINAQFFHKLFINPEVARQVFYPLPYLFGRFFYLQSAQTLQNRLQISHKGGGRNDNDFFLLESVFYQVNGGSFHRANLIDEQVVKYTLGRDKHKSEIGRVLVRPDIFGSFVNSVFQVLFEKFFQFFFFRRIGLVDYFIVIFQAEF